MTSLSLYIEVVRGRGVYETVAIREYENGRPGYIPEIGDYIVLGSQTYQVVGRRTSFPAVLGGPDCFLTLNVKEVRESRLKRLWDLLRGRNQKLLEP